MEEVTIITRDINGKRIYHYPTWDNLCDYVNNIIDMLKEDEILAIYVDDHCIYSGLSSDPITWEDVLGFFA